MPKLKKAVTTKKTDTPNKKAVTGLTIPVYDINGKEKSTLELPKEIFSVDVNKKLLAHYIRVYLANQRQGTASTKTRAEIIGTTKKIYRQKGTGNARHGSKKAPIFVGGGVVGGPRPRDYSLKINNKQVKKAFFNSLTLKFKEKNIFGLSNDFLKIEPKTKNVVNFLKTLGIEKEKVLLILPKLEKNSLVLSTRNLGNVKVLDVSSLNPFEVLKSSKIFILQDGLQVMLKRFIAN